MTAGPAFAPDVSFLLLAAAVGLAFTTGAATGFGSMVIALTLGAQLYPIPHLLPLLLPLSVLLTALVVLRNREHVDVRLLATRVLPPMGIGLAVGFTLFVNAPAQWLKPALGVLVVCLSIVELRRLSTLPGAPVQSLGPIAFTGTTVGAGLIQGVVASGGPVLVYALGRLDMPKATFRATLSVVWLTMNAVLVVTYVGTGRLGMETVPYVALLAPVVLASIALGNRLHHRLDEAAFRKVAMVLLGGAGAALLF